MARGLVTPIATPLRFRVRYDDVDDKPDQDGILRDPDICSQAFYVERMIVEVGKPIYVVCCTTGEEVYND